MAALDLSKSSLIDDPRTNGWPLMEFTEMAAVGVGYILIVLLAPIFLKKLNVKPMELYLPRVLHNFLLTGLSLYMCVEMLRQAHLSDNWYGPIVRGEQGIGMARILYIYYLSKILEFNDTFIMILRHKFSQISFLHIYHHSSVLAIWWFNVRYYPGGEAYPSAWLNSFVHVWMYSYYLLSTLGYACWWKKYITQLQISQLSLFVVQGISLLFTGAEEFKFIGMINGIYAATLVILFMNFYQKSYTQKQASKRE